MFVNDKINRATYDGDRNIRLIVAGNRKDEDGIFFVISRDDVDVPFQASYEHRKLPDRDWWIVDWTILSLGHGPIPVPVHGAPPAYQSSFSYKFTSAEEERDVVKNIEEALRAFGLFFDVSRCEVGQVVIDDKAWTYSENRLMAERERGDLQNSGERDPDAKPQSS